MHGNITPAPASQSLEQLGAEIMAHIAAAKRAQEKSLDHLTVAGLQLAEARSRAPDFAAFLRGINLKRSQAYHLMRLATNGKTTVELERAKIAERVRKHRAAKDRPLRNGQYPACRAQKSEAITVEDDLEVDEYREAFLLRAADAMAFAVYSGEIDREVIAAAERVAVKWKNFAQALKGKYGEAAKIEVGIENEIPADLSIPEFLRRAA
jgi:hypothetical protein